MGNNNCDFSGENNPNYKTGYATSGQRKSFYNTWQNMKGRCLNKNHPKYHRYGGRGIKIHKTWLEIKGFAEWCFDNGWQEGLTLDRINNDGDYCPENCQWVTPSANSRKKSTTKLSWEDAQDIRERIKNGESEMNIAKSYGVVHGTIWFIVNGYTHVEDGKCTEKLKSRNKRS